MATNNLERSDMTDSFLPWAGDRGSLSQIQGIGALRIEEPPENVKCSQSDPSAQHSQHFRSGVLRAELANGAATPVSHGDRTFDPDGDCDDVESQTKLQIF
jgi:hypothetical protein